MSINTANLITTENGQVALADVHAINARLFADHREISVKLLFPYIAISNKKPDEVTAVESSSDADIRAERCYAPVDVCQVQTYAVENAIKRDFTIGGLFDVKLDIPDARTIILFCKTHIADNRSAGKKARDGNRDAATVLSQDYGYEVTQLPFAYTTILDSTGTYDEENGLAIGASKYGRSRHRFYFNYIIDNNSGIGDNITVDDNVYPYSDGYLSKTAFELGLKRYEKAVESYQAEYEKYANGHKLYYDTMADAIKWANPGHKFFITNNEAVGNVDVDLQAQNGTTWDVWPDTSDENGLWKYRGYEVINNKAPTGGNDAGRSYKAAGLVFEFSDVRPVEIVEGDTVKTELLPVRFKFFMFMRDTVTFHSIYSESTLCYYEVYHAMRCWVQIGNIESLRFNKGFELLYLNDEEAIAPNCPSIGKIRLTGSKIEFGMLIEKVDINYVNFYTYTNNALFKKVEISDNTVTFTDKVSFRCGQYLSQTNNESGYLGKCTFSNFAGGNSFSSIRSGGSETSIVNVYEIPKNFDIDNINVDMKPSLEIEAVSAHASAFGVLTNIIEKDAVLSRKCDYGPMFNGGFQYAYKDGKFVAQTQFFENFDWGSGGSDNVRIVSETRLHNGRVIVLDAACTGTVLSPASGTDVIVHAFINNRHYRLNTTYGEICSNFLTSMSNATLLEVYEANVNNLGELCVKWKIHIKQELGENVYHWDVVTNDSQFNMSEIARYVAIEDVDGQTNIIRETLA